MLLLLFSTLIHFFIQPFTIHRNNEDEKDALRLEMAAGRLREKEELNLEIKELKRKLESELEKRMRRKRGREEVDVGNEEEENIKNKIRNKNDNTDIIYFDDNDISDDIDFHYKRRLNTNILIKEHSSQSQENSFKLNFNGKKIVFVYSY